MIGARHGAELVVSYVFTTTGIWRPDYVIQCQIWRIPFDSLLKSLNFLQYVNRRSEDIAQLHKNDEAETGIDVDDADCRTEGVE